MPLNRQSDNDDATFTDTVFGFFGVPAATGRQRAVDLTNHAIVQTQKAMDSITELQAALLELEETLKTHPGDKT